MKRNILRAVRPGMLTASVLAILITWSSPVTAQCVASLSNADVDFIDYKATTNSGNKPVGQNKTIAQLLTSALATWQGCDETETAMPGLSTVGSGQDFTVKYIPSGQMPSGCGASACGCAVLTLTPTSVSGTLYLNKTEFDNASSTCSIVGPLHTMMHETGHSLLLGNGTCSGYVMKPGDSQTIPEGSECSMVLGNFTTSAEQSGECLGPGCEETPLVLDLDGGGIVTTDLLYGAVFDIDGDGVPEVTSWINYDTADAFLWIDLNGNRRVDGGNEFFGSATTLPSGAPAGVKNGFEALALYDEVRFGGNGNGHIDRGDRVWARLLLWLDRDGDGRSRRQEIMSIQRAGIVRLDLAYQEIWEVDGNQNVRLARGRYWVRDARGTLVSREVQDIVFRVAQ